MNDDTTLNKEWRDTVAEAISIAHWLERHLGAPGWFEKKREFDVLVEHADVLNTLLR